MRRETCSSVPGTCEYFRPRGVPPGDISHGWISYRVGIPNQRPGCHRYGDECRPVLRDGPFSASPAMHIPSRTRKCTPSPRPSGRCLAGRGKTEPALALLSSSRGMRRLKRPCTGSPTLALWMISGLSSTIRARDARARWWQIRVIWLFAGRLLIRRGPLTPRALLRPPIGTADWRLPNAATAALPRIAGRGA